MQGSFWTVDYMYGVLLTLIKNEINFDTLNVSPLVIVHFFFEREHFKLDLYIFFCMEIPVWCPAGK